VGSYTVLYISPRKICHYSVFIFAFGFLSYLHVKRMIEDYGAWRVDTATQSMIHVLKVCSVAYCYRDGNSDVKDEALFKH